jgi:hypothetical protein
MNRLELLEHRLARLETKNHWLRLLSGIACAFAVMPYLLAATLQQKNIDAELVSADKVYAREFRFMNSPVHLMDHFGGLGIYSYDYKDGRWSHRLIASIEAGRLQVYDPFKGEVTGVSLESRETGGQVTVNRRDGNPVAAIVATDIGGRLDIGNSTGMGDLNRTAVLGADSTGGFLRLSNGSGLTSVMVDSQPYGGDMRVFNLQRKVVGALGINQLGAGNFIIANEDGKISGWLSTVKDGSSGGLQLLNPSGGVVFHAP